MDCGKVQYAILTMLLATSMPSTAQTVGDIRQIQAETLVLRAMAARAEAQAKLDEHQKLTATGAAVSGVDSDEPVLPVVKGVYGSGRLVANLLFSNNSTIEAAKGDVLPGGFVVADVSIERVELRRKGKSYPLGFSQIKPIAPEKQIAPQGMPSPLPMIPMAPTATASRGAP